MDFIFPSSSIGSGTPEVERVGSEPVGGSVVRSEAMVRMYREYGVGHRLPSVFPVGSDWSVPFQPLPYIHLEGVMSKPLLALFLTLVFVACAPRAPGAPRPNSNLITRAEIDEAGPSSAYNLIQNLRPVWLRERGAVSFTDETDLAVYLDGTRLGGRGELRNIYTHNIESLEFLDARRATNRFGAGHVNGAILIRTRS